MNAEPRVPHSIPRAVSALAFSVATLAVASCADDAAAPNTPESPAAVTLVSGVSQTGVAGHELGDSIVAFVEGPSGRPVANASVTWSVTGGTLSSSQSLTDATGHSSVAWRAGEGAHTLTVARPGHTATTTATGLAPASCGFASNLPNAGFGPLDTTRARPTGRTLRVAALFIDFPDQPATQTIAQIMTEVVQPGVAKLTGTSDGQISLDIVPSAAWIRMTESVNDMRWNDFFTHRTYIDTVLNRFDPVYDFSATDIVWIFRSSRNDPQVLSGAMLLKQNDFWAVPPRDGREMRSFVTFGGDVLYMNVYPHWPQYGAHIVAHETGHLLGLPDLYAYSYDPGDRWDGLRFTGGWSFMGWVAPATSLFAAERLHVGVIPAAEVLCPPQQPFSAVVTLRPLAEPTGLRAIGLRGTATRLTFLEVRRRLGIDAALCATGLLVYDVNGDAGGGAGGVFVREIHASTAGAEEERCGNKWNATAQVGDAIDIGAPDVRVTVLSETPDGAMKVRITRR